MATGMKLAAATREALRSPMVWVALVIAALGAMATIAVGVELFQSTAVPMSFNRR
jgi:Mn2+/Fe2+ NRAMP family transporter